MPLLGPEPTETLMAHLLPNPSELYTLRTEMNERFDRIDERFDTLNDRINGRFDRINGRFDRINGRFDRMLIAQIGGFTALVVAVFLN